MCGLGSRRQVEEIVTAKRVKVNEKLVTNLATDIDPQNDKVSVDGKKVAAIHKHLYIALHKPKGCVCTTNDEKGRKTVLDYIDNKFKNKRIFPVGRLDYETEGLLLLTTDGETANRILHPSSELAKTYQVRIEGEIPEKDLDKMRKGLEIDGVKLKPCKVKMLEVYEDNTTRLEVTISEGRNRQVRRMFDTFNRSIVFLKRTAIGEIRLGGLSRGEMRELTPKEIDFLKRI